MNRVALPCIILLAIAACSPSADYETDTAATDTAAAARSDTATSTGSNPSFVISHRGMAPVMIGMTIAEASAATGMTLSARGEMTNAFCTYVDWPGGPAGIGLMAENGRIVRIDVDGSTIATSEGVRVGDSADRVSQLYAGRVTTTPHKYEASGKYLIVRATEPADSSYRLVFETSNGRVTGYRAGILPAVEYVERCG